EILNNFEKITNNYYKNKIQKFNKYQKNKLNIYLEQKIKDQIFYKDYLKEIEECKDYKKLEKDGELNKKYEKLQKTFTSNMLKQIYNNLINRYLNIAKYKYNFVDNKTGLETRIKYEVDKTIFLPTLIDKGHLDIMIKKKIYNQNIKNNLQNHRQYLKTKLYETSIIFILESFSELVNDNLKTLTSKIIDILDKEL
ncbi:34763_t:CDS:1, partial [Gigaspora margarita]